MGIQPWAQEGWASSEPPLASDQGKVQGRPGSCTNLTSPHASPGAELGRRQVPGDLSWEKAGRQRGHQKPLPRSGETSDTDSDIRISGTAQDFQKDSSKTDERSFTDNQVHFTDGNIEAQGLGSKAQQVAPHPQPASLCGSRSLETGLVAEEGKPWLWGHLSPLTRSSISLQETHLLQEHHLQDPSCPLLWATRARLGLLSTTPGPGEAELPGFSGVPAGGQVMHVVRPSGCAGNRTGGRKEGEAAVLPTPSHCTVSGGYQVHPPPGPAPPSPPGPSPQAARKWAPLPHVLGLQSGPHLGPEVLGLECTWLPPAPFHKGRSRGL